MSAPAVWSVVLALLAIFGAVTFLMLRADHAYIRADREAPTQVLPVIGWTHDAPLQPFTVADAHREMQRHRSCLREDCPRKQAAWRTLVGAGHIRPDTGRNY
jgi:hypothetical protein